MNISFLIEMLFNIIRGFLFNSAKAAPYTKWFLRIRDYLNLLFPVAMYPANSTNDPALTMMNVKPVSIDAAKAAATTNGFDLSFLK